MRVLRPLALSLLTGVLVQSACFKAPEDRDFGKSGSNEAGGGSNDASAGGSSGSSGASTAGGASNGGRGGGTAGGGTSGGAQMGGTSGDAQAPDAGRHCNADADCDDRDTCSGAEKCVGSVCKAGTALANKTACSVATVSADAGAIPGLCFDGTCLKKCADTSDCDNKNACDGQETCDGSRGVCVSGVAPKCDDSNDCTQDSCDSKTGACVNELVDADGDGHAPSNLGSCGNDCNDSDKTVYKGAPELCDNKDNDCNGTTDDNTPFWYVDCDGDGFSNSTTNAVQQCTTPTTGPSICGGNGKWTAVAPVSPATQDCNDAAPGAYPGNPEVCSDGLDNDCSGTVDDLLPKKWADCDADGYARANAPAQYQCVYNNGAPASCTMGSWTTIEPVKGSTDCDDGNSAIWPYASEDCSAPDNVDNNCDGVVDGYRWYRDCDADGYAATGASNAAVDSCAQPVAATGCRNGAGNWITQYPIGDYADCDDENSLVYPYAGYQTVQDSKWGWDYNCDGETSKQFTSTGVTANDSCVLSGSFFLFCTGADGWTGSTVPECGEYAESSMCNCETSGGIFFCNSCARNVSSAIAQGCR